jgi:DNA sulfur modification protein DndD
MLLERIVLSDFRCFYGEQNIEFSTDQSKNVTLIHAENGVGKTTLLNAMLWCFYGSTTAKFERKADLVHYDAIKAGRTKAFVEVTFLHNKNRYRARRYAGSNLPSERVFSIVRLEGGHSPPPLPNPDSFINSVIPKSMASHFLFDGEHAELFLGEDNRKEIRKAVQDILGCNLIETAIGDLEAAASYYRRQMPKAKQATSLETLRNQIDVVTTQIAQAKDYLSALRQEIEGINQQIADIDEKLRNSSAAKELQTRRENTERDLDRAKKRMADATDEMLKWLGENGRFLVSTKITEQAFDNLETEETKGRLPSPYNEEFVKDLLELKRCICGAELPPGSPAHDRVASLLKKAANHTLRSRLNGIRAIVSQLKSQRDTAPARLSSANKRLTEANEDVGRLEASLAEISSKLAGVNFGDIAEREKRRNQLRAELGSINQKIGTFEAQIQSAEQEKIAKQRELKKLAENDDEARIFVTRDDLCELLKGHLEHELEQEESLARQVLKASINRVLSMTGRKNLRLKMSDEYAISLVNEEGTQLPKSSGENQLLGLAFTAALVEFAKKRQTAEDYRLLKGTIAPLVLDSPFGQLDKSYRKTTALQVPQMASQVVLMISGSQGDEGVMEALKGRIGNEYVLVRLNKGPRGSKPKEIRQFHGKDVQTAVFDAEFDGTHIMEVE